MNLWPFRRQPNACTAFLPFMVEVTTAPPPRKPRIRIRADGWVRHDGGMFPFDPRAFVEVIYACGERRVGEWAEPASATLAEWWQQRATNPRYNVRFYRIVSEPTFGEVQP